MSTFVFCDFEPMLMLIILQFHSDFLTISTVVSLLLQLTTECFSNRWIFLSLSSSSATSVLAIQSKVCCLAFKPLFSFLKDNIGL